MATYTLTISDHHEGGDRITIDHSFDPPLPVDGFIQDLSAAHQAGCKAMQNLHDLLGSDSGGTDEPTV